MRYQLLFQEQTSTLSADQVLDLLQRGRVFHGGQVARIARDLFIPCVSVEINGIGKFLPAILRRELARLRVPCTVQEMSSRKAKAAWVNR